MARRSRVSCEGLPHPRSPVEEPLLIHPCIWMYGVEHILGVAKLGPCLGCYELFPHSVASCIFALKYNVRGQFFTRHSHSKKDSATICTSFHRLASHSVATIGKSPSCFLIEICVVHQNNVFRVVASDLDLLINI
jgi:hypothetical protein